MVRKNYVPPAMREAQEMENLKGDAHRAFEKFAGWTTDKKTKKRALNLTKSQLGALMAQMHKEQRIRFVNSSAIESWVDTNFVKFDTNQNGFLSLDEFVHLYREFLCSDPESVAKQLTQTVNEIERLFLMFDQDGTFALDKTELLGLLKNRNPVGLPPPPDEQLLEIVDNVFSAYAGSDSLLDFDEFGTAFNTMIDQLNELHAAMRKAAMDGSIFAGMKDGKWDADEAELEELERMTASRFERQPWICRLDEIIAVAGSVVDRARAAGKIALLLKHPEQEMDDVTQKLSTKGVQILDMQAMCMDMCDGSKSDKEAAEEVRSAIVDAMRDGKVLVLRLGNSAPDFMMQLNMKSLPLDALRATVMQPGPLHKDAHGLLTKADGPPERYRVHEGFHLVFTSCFHSNNWKQFLRGKLPFGELQPVQMCRSIQQVAVVMKDGLPADNSMDALSAMDALADML